MAKCGSRVGELLVVWASCLAAIERQDGRRVSPGTGAAATNPPFRVCRPARSSSSIGLWRLRSTPDGGRVERSRVGTRAGAGVRFFASRLVGLANMHPVLG